MCQCKILWRSRIMQFCAANFKTAVQNFISKTESRESPDYHNCHCSCVTT
jgi:hypothetical protein